MGKEKGGFLTPKAIANRIKAKGLQKLRWFCQMCQKQCRDENGFKCHLTSESHQRQLLLFADNPDQYIDSFSKEFLDDFSELLRRRFGTKRVHANIVYQEYIANKEHTHMNATQWETLTDFVKWMGKEGHCVVDETEKGWFIQYIDRDWEAIKKQEAALKKDKMEMDDDERTARFIEKQIQRAAATGKQEVEISATELQRDNEEEKVAFSMNAAKKEDTSKKMLSTAKAFSKKLESEGDNVGPSSTKPSTSGLKRKTALDEIMEQEEIQKEKKNRKDYWLHSGIVVKVITKKLGEKYYKKKGVIRDVQDKFVAIVKMLDSGDKLKIDQGHLETVIPALGKTVMVINGAYRGQEATLIQLREKKFCCSISINSGLLKGRVVENVQYEDISKLHIVS